MASVLLDKVECLYVYLSVCLLLINSAPLQSTPHMIHIVNQHDPWSVLVYQLLALIVC